MASARETRAADNARELDQALGPLAIELKLIADAMEARYRGKRLYWMIEDSTIQGRGHFPRLNLLLSERRKGFVDELEMRITALEGELREAREQSQ